MELQMGLTESNQWLAIIVGVKSKVMMQVKEQLLITGCTTAEVEELLN
jgi:hypothetical protein